MTTTKVTRKTIVGFGYTSACENDESGWLRNCATTAPCHTGTLKSINQKIRDDLTLRSFTNTYYSSAWFIRVAGQWRKVIDPCFGDKVDDLYEADYRGNTADAVYVEIA